MAQESGGAPGITKINQSNFNLIKPKANFIAFDLTKIYLQE